jgi:alpha-amylase
MNAITFTLLQDGIPITYYGQEQFLSGAGVPQNREALWSTGGYDTTSALYKMIASVNAVRNQAIYKDSTWTTTLIETPYYDANTIVTRKGGNEYQIVAVYDNRGQNGASSSLTVTSTMSGFSGNEEVMEILTCEVYTTDSSGSLVVQLGGGQPKVFFPKSALPGNGLCQQYTSELARSGASNSAYNISWLHGTIELGVYLRQCDCPLRDLREHDLRGERRTRGQHPCSRQLEPILWSAAVRQQLHNVEPSVVCYR